MKKSTSAEEQIVGFLKQVEGGVVKGKRPANSPSGRP
jgi:hypothetical protein